MGTVRRVLFGLLLAVLALAQAPADPPLPPNPHQSMNEPAACADCHRYYREDLDPHEFFVSIPEKCWECHAEEKLGRSHPIGIDPRRATTKVDVPEDLPLEDGKVSCGTCHQPHKEHLSGIKAFADQQPAFPQARGRAGGTLYKTLFLRKSDPARGFEPLCMACHKDY